jgi:dTDP-4-dehydrorhamnose 3,5-epimerase-like enzyme
MKVLETALSGVLLLEPPAFSDARGQFFKAITGAR